MRDFRLILRDYRGQEPDQALAEHPKSFFVSCTEYLDWDKIALPVSSFCSAPNYSAYTNILSFDQFPRRTAMDCKIQWLQVDHPAVNKGKWSAEELDSLYAIVEKKHEKDWLGIANELGVSFFLTAVSYKIVYLLDFFISL